MARNRNRKPGPIRRTTVTALLPAQPVSRNPGARAHSESYAPSAAGARIRRTRVTLKGQAGPWSQPMHLKPTDPAMTRAWDLTAKDFR